MPQYTYRCNQCDHEFTVRQRMVDDPLTECPACGGDVRRVVTSVGVVFKGSGFYVTDNRTSRVNGGKSSSSSKSNDSSSSSDSSSESKGSESKSSEKAASSSSSGADG